MVANIWLFKTNTRTSNFEEAKRKINELDDNFNNLSTRQKAWYEPYFNYQKALFHFHQMEYDKSRKFTMLAIDNYSGELDIILGNAFLLQGMAYDKVNKRTEARESYNNCIDLDNFSFAIIKAKKYLEIPYSEI